MSPDHYEKRLRDVDGLVAAQRPIDSVVASCRVFEDALRDLWGKFVPQMQESADRDEISTAEAKLKELADTTTVSPLRRLVMLYQSGRVFEKLRHPLRSDLHRIRAIHWDQLVEFGHAAASPGSAEKIGQIEAEQVLLWLKVFLHETQLIRDLRSAPPKGRSPEAAIPPACAECKTPLQREWKFCPQCGTCVHLDCLKCETQLKPNFRICPVCETPVRGPGSIGTNGQYEYEFLCRGVYLDFVVTSRERKMLDQKRLELGLTLEQAEVIERRIVSPETREYRNLVEAAYIDGTVHVREREFLERKRKELNITTDVAAAIEETVQESMREPRT